MENKHITNLSCKLDAHPRVELQNYAVSQAGKGLSSLTGLWSKDSGSQDLQGKQVAGYPALSNKLRYQSEALTHLCQNQLVQGRQKIKKH